LLTLGAGVDVRIRRGEFVVILGKSGGGKTSMLNIIGTIDKPTKGEITICKKRITSNTTDEEFAQLRLRKMCVDLLSLSAPISHRVV
jgi:putative ABC transport system ATP-binding protein